MTKVRATNAANKPAYSKLRIVATKMKKRPTRAESRMWSCLRDRRLGAKFRQQHVIGTFIVDFYCLEKSLVIEIDGGIHDSQKDRDRERENCLNDLDCRVLRFSNDQVMNDIRAVKKKIKAELNSH